MNDLKFECAHCKQHLEAPPEMFGTTIDCPTCGTRIQVPQLQMAAHAMPPSEAVRRNNELRTEEETCPTRTRPPAYPSLSGQPKRSFILLSTVGLGVLLASGSAVLLHRASHGGPATAFTVTTLAGSQPKAPWRDVDGKGSAARLDLACAIPLDKSGAVYWVQHYAIRKITPEGGVSTFVGKGGICEKWFDTCSGAAVDGDGNLYITDSGMNPYPGPAIYKITPSGAMTVIATNHRYRGTVPRQSSHMVGETSPDIPIFGPGRIMIDGAGNLYFSDAGNVRIGDVVSTVFRITPAGVVSVVATFPAKKEIPDSAGLLALFLDLAGVDDCGNVYVYFMMDDDNDSGLCLRKITPNGLVTTLGGGPLRRADGQGKLSNAAITFPYYWSSLAIASNGTMYVAEGGKKTICEISEDGVVTIIAGIPDESGVVDGPGRIARFTNPRAVSVDENGCIYVADGNFLRKIEPQ